MPILAINISSLIYQSSSILKLSAGQLHQFDICLNFQAMTNSSISVTLQDNNINPHHS